MPIVDRASRVILAGLAAYTLQQWPVSYQVDLFGIHAVASLAHLHAGLLLALAMMYEDRIYLRTAFVFTFFGWLWHARGEGYPEIILLLTPGLYVLIYGWTVWCASRMGWPRPLAEQQVGRGDIARFAFIGLLLYPIGWATTDYAMTAATIDPNTALNDAIQTLFAKHFGVSVVTLPLLVLFTERAPEPRRYGASFWVVWALLVLGFAINLLATFVLSHTGTGKGILAAIMDYRFALVAILTACVLWLSPRAVMPVLMSVQFLLLFSLAQATPRMGEVIGVFQLTKVAFELSVLQLLMVVLVIIKRDRDALFDHFREESQREAITGLRNLNGLCAALKEAAPPPREVAYLTLANLDRLAGGFGLRAQESLMQGVAKHLADQVDSFHMGTGQFALIPLNAEAPVAWDSVLQRLERYDFLYGGESLRLTPYLGVAALEGSSLEQIDGALDAASTAAQDAALRGETHPVRVQAEALLDTSSANRDAMAVASLALARLRQREIQLYFQPIKRIGEPPEQYIRYGEVLCRLGEASGKLLMPNTFIRELEARGRSTELDLAVIDCLFRWLREHAPGVDLPRLGINLTGRSVTSESFRETLLGLIDAAPVPPASLSFEITETAAIERFSDARRLVADLRGRGCHIALDDFGIGMQSFERLRELPFDVVKIDGSFVRGLAERSQDAELIRASVAVARAYGATTVAEYVENGDVAEHLKQLGVEWGQGDYFGIPVPIDFILTSNKAIA